MGMTAVEKVLAAKSRRQRVSPGDLVYPDPDFVLIHDNAVMRAKRELDGLGLDALAAPEKVVMTTDHDALYGSARAAERGAFNRLAAKQWGVTQFFDVGRGGHGHIFPMETGMLLPGMFYFDNDRHCTNAGAIGAFGFSIAAEITRVLATGTNWVAVPKSIRLTIAGRLRPGVHARDLGFYLARAIGNGELDLDLDYRVLEFAGDLDWLSLAARTALCSSPTEMRACGVFFPPSEAIVEHARSRARREFTPVFADADAQYEKRVELDVSALEPQVVLPGSVDRSVDISEAPRSRVDHAFIGSCGSGMYEDLQAAAAILEGRRIASRVRLFVAPGSEESTRRMAREGLMQTFIEAGAIMLPAGCGPCNDAVVGPLHSGEISISTATNNKAGLFGARDAQLYLGSPATVAASCVAGRICDARELAHEA